MSENDRHSIHRHWTLEELLQTSDIISLHVPSTPETHHLINAERIRLMKPNTILTPHIGFASEEALVRRTKIVFDNIYAYLDNMPKIPVQL